MLMPKRTKFRKTMKGRMKGNAAGGTTLNFGKANLSYRYQHISNAHIYKENPGLDLHMVGLGMRF